MGIQLQRTASGKEGTEMRKLMRTSMVAPFIAICLSLTWALPAQAEVFSDGGTHDVDYPVFHFLEVYDGPDGMPTTVNLLDGAWVFDGEVRVAGSSVVNMYGGEIMSLAAYNSSTINMHGGNAGSCMLMENATLNVYDTYGNIGIGGRQNSTVNIYGGMLAGGDFLDSSIVNIYGLDPLQGGNTSYIYVGSVVEQGNTATVNIYGSDFQIDGQAVGYGPIPITLVPRTLTGTLVYGDVFTLGFQNWCAPPQGTINLIATNQDPVADAGPDRNVEQISVDGAEVTLDGSASSDPDGDPLTYSWTWENGGNASGATSTVTLPAGTTTVTLVVNDGTADSEPDSVDITVEDTIPPEISIVEPIAYGLYPAGSLMLDFDATDSGSGVSDYWGTLTDAYGYSGNVDSGFAPGAGIYHLLVEATDVAGNYAAGISDLFVVYDSEGGFVTGGGWIWSPLGAYMDDPSLEGRANFGFVSKYKKGATVPTGNTEFVFQAGDLNFHSSSYEWLVVTGSNYARFKGAGTINGSGDYKFMLWAGDGPDTFRIRIWTEDAGGLETDVYDNGMDQPIGGGSIVIHAN